MVRFYEGADGLKTGHTDAAGYCLAATAVKNDLRLIAIVLGESDSKVRNSETMDFLDYGFSNIKMSVLKKKGEVVQELDLEKAEPSKIQIVLQNNLGVVEDLDTDTHKYCYDIQLDKIELPLKSGDVVGKILVKENDKIVSTGTLVVDEEVLPLSYLQLFYRGIKDLVSGEI